MGIKGQRGVVEEAKAWPVRPSRAGLLGLAGVVVLLAITLGALAWAIGQFPGAGSLVAVSVASLSAAGVAVLLVLVLGVLRLRYRFTSDALLVDWTGPSEAIRYHEIDGIYAGQRVGQLRRIQGVSYPGYYAGLVRSRALGPLRVFATAREADALSVIVVGDRTFVLTPSDPPAFRRELIRRIEASQSSAHQPVPAAVARRRLPDPLIAACAAVSLVLIGAVLGGIVTHFQALPDMIPLRPEALGRPGQLSPRAEIYSIPLFGAIALLVNFFLIAVLRSERGAVILLGGTGVLVEAILLLSTVRLLS
jgi:hypothetical protein